MTDQRTAELERLFGDPDDPANPVGYSAALTADERAVPFAAGEAVLDRWHCNAEFVPEALGGRWRAVDELGRRLRPVFRRDAALGLGYGVTSLMAAVNVWVGGNDRQQRLLAADLLAGQRGAVAFHESAHGNDLLRNEFRAEPDGLRLRLTGTKQVINNADRAGPLVLFARTDDRAGPRAHSLLLLDRAGLPASSIRYRTSAIRGAQLGAIDLHSWPVSADALIGAPGSGVETALRAFQLTRAALPAMAVGVLDGALHTAYRFAVGRRLYGTRVVDMPHAQAVLTTAFTDLSIADCLATAVARGLHLAPAVGAAPTAASKYLVPLLIEDAMYDLSVLLGSTFYLREGPFAHFGKFYRDVAVLGIGHAGPMACLMTIVPLLPRLARRAWSGATAPAALFHLEDVLPPLPLDTLALSGAGTDLLAATLPSAEARAAGQRWPRPVVTAIAEIAEHLRALGDQARALQPAEFAPGASSETFALARRYAVLLAAAACLGLWEANRGKGGVGSDALLVAMLHRLLARLGRRDHDLPTDLVEPLLAEVSRRASGRRSFGVLSEPIFPGTTIAEGDLP